jgi:hypothetical protein
MYVQFTLHGRNKFICYVLPGTEITEIPANDGEIVQWFYGDGTVMELGDVITEDTEVWLCLD